MNKPVVKGMVVFGAMMLALTVDAATVSGQGTWETTLLGRDAAGVAVDVSSSNAVFIYDISLNVTWLKNANLNGPMEWSTASAWAQSLQVGAIKGWRLPNIAAPDFSCSPSSGYPSVFGQGFDAGCTGSEMGHLFNVSLGNSPSSPISNTGNFDNVQNYYYWTGTALASNPYYVWTYQTAINGQGYTGTGTNSFFAIAVRNGDVIAAVPEPETYGMMLAGLWAVGVVASRRKSQQI